MVDNILLYELIHENRRNTCKKPGSPSTGSKNNSIERIRIDRK